MSDLGPPPRDDSRDPFDDSGLDSFIGRVADEFLELQEKGRTPSLEEFISRYPEHAEVLRDLLPMLGAFPEGAADDDADPFKGLKVPKRLGDYHLVRELGRGGMGIVYEAIQLSLRRRVALKTLSAPIETSEAHRQRFESEARAAAMLDHPNIVPVFANGEQDQQLYFAMQLIEGNSLAALASQERRSIDANDQANSLASSWWKSIDTTDRYRSIASLGKQIAEALHHAHERGVIHRDVKPSNIMVDTKGHPWITDFGLALVRDEATITKTGELVGTLRYMSPEQVVDSRLISHRTDIYSLGATLYELLASRSVIDGDNPKSVLHRILEHEPPPLRTLDPTLPVDLQTIVTKAIQKEAHERYETAADLAADLGRFLNHLPIQAKPLVPIDYVFKWARRNRRVVTTAASLLVTLLVVSVVSLIAVSTAYRREHDARTKLETANLENRRQLSRMYVERSKLGETDDVMSALPWLAAALKLDEGDPQRERMSRIRMGMALRACPKLEQLWKLPERPSRVLLAPNASTALVLYQSGGAELWNTRTARRAAQRQHSDSRFTAAAYTLDGNMIVTGDDRGVVHLRQSSAFSTHTHTFSHSDAITRILCHPKGRLVATASRDASCMLWDMSSKGQHLGPFQHDSEITDISFDPDGSHMLTVSNDKTARVWNINNGTPTTHPLLHSSAVISGLINASATQIVTSTSDCGVRIWNIDSESVVFTDSQLDSPIICFAWSSQGRFIAGVDTQSQMHVWDLHSGMTRSTYNNHSPYTSSHNNNTTLLLCHPSNTILSCSRQVSLRHLPSGNAAISPISRVLDSHAVCSNGILHIVTIDPTLTTRYWSTHVPFPNQQLFPSRKVTASCPIGRTNRQIIALDDNSVHDVDLVRCSTICSFPRSADLTDIRVSTDNSTVALVHGQRNVTVYNIARPTPHIARLQSNEPVVDLQLSNDTIALLGKSGSVEVWSYSGHAPKRSRTLSHPSSTSFLRFNHSGDTLLLGSPRDAVLVDLSTGLQQQVTDRPILQRIPNSVVQGDPGTLLGAKGFESVHFDTLPGLTIRTASAEWTKVLATQGNGSKMITASNDGAVRLYDGRSSVRVAARHPEGARITSATFSQDGSLVASIFSDGYLSINSVYTGERISPSIGDRSPCKCFAFSNDNTQLTLLLKDAHITTRDLSADSRNGSRLLALSASMTGKRVGQKGTLEPVTSGTLRTLRRGSVGADENDQRRQERPTGMFPQEDSNDPKSE
ncbi:Serine/threonine-protein kinase PrkC [Planctomycetes bacterium Pan216]|uniref:Serine/threonine-protein kinase PrkC n=1 Tax=Kolteria novifilia TaxID=2527975 RepID=A0A518B0F1_9BACT|nr:Serine/threonine-protein kinase PrkC [Planctomycetes bacterium Pan216]